MLTHDISGLVWGMGTVLGPVVGGGFVIVDWRWGFYINLVRSGRAECQARRHGTTPRREVAEWLT